MNKQTFVDTETETWFEFQPVPGTKLLPLAEPVPKGSIHKLQMIAGTVIPVHYHPCDEYVYVLKGTIETTGCECKAGTFWFTPAHTQNGPHKAITSVELITIRLGEMGIFEEL
ncbi:cupin domain-containing protein [uncultured Nostoc sp.]|uniref:cupin domain-containing protein n=1 Tax=uncultured Nostoc sp. TaxID=340711 RepID=UPI0035CA4A8D